MIKQKTKSVSQKKALASRPPVVAILGHVDHGKTTLLSKIKEVDLTKREYGGISQHIGAYQIKIKTHPSSTESRRGREKSKIKKITFIDTPGHLAFSQMRSRGAKVADLVVLVVAVDEGVKPQTLESLKHIQSANIPYLVALTKIDIPNTDIERVKKDLVKYDIVPEGQGGDVVSVPLSAKTGKGIGDLLEMIVILAEMAELKGSLDNSFKGVVIESSLDSRRGPLATILVQDGSLRVGDEIMVEDKISKIKAMLDEDAGRVDVAGPSKPVVVLGFKEAPIVGGKVKKADGRTRRGKLRKTEDNGKTLSVPPESSEPSVVEDSEKKLRIILKADTLGTLEAVTKSLPREVQIIHSGVGNVSGSDVLLAEATGSEINAFGVKIASMAKKLAETEKIKIASFTVIYQLLEDIEKKVLKMLEPAIDEEILGQAEILQEFEIDKKRVAGCQVIEGEVKKINRLHLLRQGEVMADCRIKSMKTGKRTIEKAKKGEEFGAVLSPSLDFSAGDVLVSFRKVEEP